MRKFCALTLLQFHGNTSSITAKLCLVSTQNLLANHSCSIMRYCLNSRFPLFVRLAQTRDRRPLRKEERQSSYYGVSFSAYSQFTDSVLLHIRATLRWVRHNSAARFVSALLRTVSAKINCTKRLIRRCRALQRAKDLRGTVMPRLALINPPV